MRVFMTTDAIGGVWRYSKMLAAALATGGTEVRLGVVGEAPETGAPPGIDAVHLGVPLDWLAGSADGLAAARRRIAAAAGSWDADVIQINQPAFAGDGYPAPVIAVAHSCVETWWRGTLGVAAPNDWGWHRDAVRDGLRRAACAVAPSAAFAAQLQQAYGLESPPRAVLNGIGPRTGHGVKQRHLLAAGRGWDESKNFAVLDRAAADILWPVRMAGSCAGLEGGHVDFAQLACLGELDAAAMADAFAAAPIFVSPSLYEPFGLAVVEAAQAGAALLLSDIPTFRELWPDAALFFDPRDPAALACQANRLILDAGLRTRLAGAARSRAKAFRIETTGREMHRLYCSVACTGWGEEATVQCA